MRVKSFAAGSVVALASLGVLVGCGDKPSTDNAAPASATSGATAQASQAAKPVSDIEAAVQKAVGALDELGIEHTDPVRVEVGLSGAAAVFDLTINGFDSGINVFPDEDALETWQELSDSLGGIHVAFDNAAISLNSSDGIANSAEIAPKIAEAIGGEAHGV